MRHVQVQLTDAQARSLSEIATIEERPVAAIVRDAVDKWIGNRLVNHDAYLVVTDLVSISEICTRAGRSINTVQSWRRRYRHFPRPVTKLAAGPIWDWDEVARWIESRTTGRASHSSNLPGFELIEQGLADLNAGRETVEALLLRSATERLASVGVEVPGGPLADAPSRMYQLLFESVGEGQAHSRFNALRRRLVSFMNAARTHSAPIG